MFEFLDPNKKMTFDQWRLLICCIRKEDWRGHEDCAAYKLREFIFKKMATTAENFEQCIKILENIDLSYCMEGGSKLVVFNRCLVLAKSRDDYFRLLKCSWRDYPGYFFIAEKCIELSKSFEEYYMVYRETEDHLIKANLRELMFNCAITPEQWFKLLLNTAPNSRMHQISFEELVKTGAKILVSSSNNTYGRLYLEKIELDSCTLEELGLSKEQLKEITKVKK